MENYRATVMERAGFDYDTLSAINPRLVYASLSGFGSDHPYREKGGVDLIAQAMGGITHVTGEPGGPPASVGLPLRDLRTGAWGATGILAAVIERERAGQGERTGILIVAPEPGHIFKRGDPCGDGKEKQDGQGHVKFHGHPLSRPDPNLRISRGKRKESLPIGSIMVWSH